MCVASVQQRIRSTELSTRRRVTRASQHRKFLDAHRDRYDGLLEFQGGGCAICGRRPGTRRLDLDHQHKEPMFLRGALCVRCNRNIPDWVTSEWLRKCADYLDCPPFQMMENT